MPDVSDLERRLKDVPAFDPPDLKTIAESGNRYMFPFDQIARAFRLIDDAQAPIIIRGGTWGIADDLLGKLECAGGTGGIARALQPYGVNVPHHIRLDLGWMLYDIDYQNYRRSAFFHAVMENGVIDVAAAVRKGLAS